MKFKVMAMVGFLFIGTIFGAIGCSSKSNSEGANPSPAVSPTPSSQLSLQGRWKEQRCNMGFEVNGNQFIEYDRVSNLTVTFAGTIVNSPDLTQANGLIIVKITQSGTAGATVGHYTVARWKNFTGNQAGQTYAKSDGDLITYATLAEAQALTESAIELSHFCCDISNRQ